MGMAYVHLKDFPAAEKALRQSIAMSAQKYAPPLLLLSMLLNDQNRPNDAEPVARQANICHAHLRISLVIVRVIIYGALEFLHGSCVVSSRVGFSDAFLKGGAGFLWDGELVRGGHIASGNGSDKLLS